MPRAPLTPISGNRPRVPELTPYQRGVLMGQLSAGMTPYRIEKTFGTPVSTVKYTQKLDLIRYQGHSLLHPGRRHKLSERDGRKLIHVVRQNPKITYASLQNDQGFKCGLTTLKEEIKAYTNWRLKKHLLLIPGVAAKRLIWCLEREHWTLEQ